ncbi:hypothetical protein RN001_001912 [Aquatica leii]|uniref:Prostaglandin reductase 1 n=1 Tax=Aquatica leii TaxID=1421715 RepID=A0AAN7PLQ2_9COLE|nr:hypothetical protein RN001_001912 [Aquatica leii]
MIRAKVYVLNKYFEGLPKKTDFKIIEEDLPPLKHEEFLAEALYLSVDPYMRTAAARLKIGTPFIGYQVARITDSKSKEYPVGTFIVGAFGWRTHTVSNGKSNVSAYPGVWKVPDLKKLPLSLAIGMVGRVGNTAYFGLLEICKPKHGETVVVSAAGGAVGSHVGQIAKIKGCKVIGITSTDYKGEWLVNELGFDCFVNYKKPNFLDTLKKCTPEGIDCYFDNVGGEISSTVMSIMNQYGRISVCGSISCYNATAPVLAPIVQISIVSLELKLEGYIVHRWADRWQEGILQNLTWIQEGKLKYKETVTEGFENTVSAFIEMLEGKNIGKSIVKI